MQQLAVAFKMQLQLNHRHAQLRATTSNHYLPPASTYFTRWTHSLAHINLVTDDEDGLVGKQCLDGVEERSLLGNGVAALLTDVHNVDARSAQMRQGCDRLRV